MALKFQTVVTQKTEVEPDEYNIGVVVTKAGDSSFDNINRMVVSVFNSLGITQDKITRVATNTRNMEIMYKCSADRYKDRLQIAKELKDALSGMYVEVEMRETLGLSEEKYNSEYQVMRKKILEQTRKGFADLAGEKKIICETVRFENVQPYNTRSYLAAEESSSLAPRQEVVSDVQTFPINIKLEYEVQYQ